MIVPYSILEGATLEQKVQFINSQDFPSIKKISGHVR